MTFRQNAVVPLLEAGGFVFTRREKTDYDFVTMSTWGSCIRPTGNQAWQIEAHAHGMGEEYDELELHLADSRFNPGGRHVGPLIRVKSPLGVESNLPGIVAAFEKLATDDAHLLICPQPDCGQFVLAKEGKHGWFMPCSNWSKKGHRCPGKRSMKALWSFD